MKRVMTQTIRLLKADYVTDLLRRLVNRGLALRSVTALADRLCGGLRGEMLFYGRSARLSKFERPKGR